VVLNMALRPDPLTGEMMNAKTAAAYFDAQIELTRDYAVTGPVVDALGWLTDPARIRAYSQRDPSDTRDFRSWLSQEVENSTKATIEGSGSALVITFRGPTPQIAAVGAETLRQAYLDAALAQRRKSAVRNAQFFTTQAEEARKLAEAAENTKAQYEKATGIIMQGRETDLDSERLAALAGQATTGLAPGAALRCSSRRSTPRSPTPPSGSGPITRRCKRRAFAGIWWRRSRLRKRRVRTP
jgi:hypothetical protein